MTEALSFWGLFMGLLKKLGSPYEIYLLLRTKFSVILEFYYVTLGVKKQEEKMQEVIGKYNTAKVFNDVIDEKSL